MTVTATVVLIAGYEPFFAMLNLKRHEPDLVGINSLEPTLLQFPDTTVHVFVPLDGVETIEVSNGVFFTLYEVVLKRKPGIAFTTRESTDGIDALLTARTL